MSSFQTPFNATESRISLKNAFLTFNNPDATNYVLVSLKSDVNINNFKFDCSFNQNVVFVLFSVGNSSFSLNDTNLGLLKKF